MRGFSPYALSGHMSARIRAPVDKYTFEGFWLLNLNCKASGAGM
jgi:hypothetical protein